jgi:hypothetical protein
MANNVAEKEPATGSSGPVLPKLITAECIQEHYAGLCWTDYLVTLPPHIGFADIAEPSIWKTVQGGNSPVRVLDRPCIVDQELSFLVEARVAAAGPEGASLAIIKKVDMPQRTEQLHSTEKWRLVFWGRGFRVVNKANGQPAPGDIGYTSFREVVAALYAMEPRIVKTGNAHRMGQ